jgi:hypothetical protein
MLKNTNYMKIFLFLVFLCAGMGCRDKATPTMPRVDNITTLIIYDTLPSTTDRFRSLYKVPPDYRVFYDSASQTYCAAYHSSNEILGDEYLKDEGPMIGILMFYEPQYATHYRHAKDIALLIRRHWAEIEADRASHQKIATQ